MRRLSLMWHALMIAAVVVLPLGACGAEPEVTIDRDTVSQRQRDSLVGASSLPGARGVEGALGAADSAAARAARLEAEAQP